MFKDRKHTQSFLIDIAVFAIVFAFFLYSVQILKKNPSNAGAGPGKLSRELEPFSRGPASTYSKNDTVKTINIGCFPQTASPVATEASMLKLEASLCFGKNKMKVTGKNKETQEEIIIFQSEKEQKFTTNYIALQPGKNAITLAFNSGKKIEFADIEIIRNSESK